MVQSSGSLANCIIILCYIKFYTNIWWGSPFSLCICFKLTKIVEIVPRFMKNLSKKHLNRALYVLLTMLRHIKQFSN